MFGGPKESVEFVGDYEPSPAERLRLIQAGVFYDDVIIPKLKAHEGINDKCLRQMIRNFNRHLPAKERFQMRDLWHWAHVDGPTKWQTEGSLNESIHELTGLISDLLPYPRRRKRNQ